MSEENAKLSKRSLRDLLSTLTAVQGPYMVDGYGHIREEIVKVILHEIQKRGFRY